MKRFLIIRKWSYLITYTIMFMLFSQYNIKTLLVFVICFITTIHLSYFQNGAIWYGYDFLQRKGISYVRNYLLSAKTISFISAKEYAKQLDTIDTTDDVERSLSI